MQLYNEKGAKVYLGAFKGPKNGRHTFIFEQKVF